MSLRSPLRDAVEVGDLDAIRQLVEAGADINEVEDLGRFSLLHVAVDRERDVATNTGTPEDARTTRLLLSLGIRTDIRDRRGRTAFDLALATGYSAAAALIGARSRTSSE